MRTKLNMRIFVASVALLFLLSSSGAASEKPSLIILPLRLNAPAGMEYLKGAYKDVVSSRIGAAGDVEIKDSSKAKNSEVQDSDGTKRALAEEAGAGFILEGSLSVLGEDLSLDVRLIKIDPWNALPMTYKGKGVGAFGDMLEKAAGDAKKAILGGVVAKTSGDKPAGRDKAWKSQRLPLVLKGMGQGSSWP